MTKKIMFFTAPWCSGCKILKPHLEKIKTIIEVEEINVEEKPNEAESYGVNSLPALFFVHDEVLVGHRIGASEATIKEIYHFVEDLPAT